jgi:predicted glycosyltransferase
LLVGDSQTMTSEAAVLGTPALKCNTFAGRLAVPNELQEKYQLCYSWQPSEFESLLEKIAELTALPNLKDLWQERKAIMLKNKIDVTAFMVWFVENLPESAGIMKNNPEYQLRFK